MIPYIYGDSGASFTRIAALAPLALALYDSDECLFSRRIIDESIDELARRVCVAINRMFDSESARNALRAKDWFPLICQGSLFTKSRLYLAAGRPLDTNKDARRDAHFDPSSRALSIACAAWYRAWVRSVSQTLRWKQ